jgi:uncharacterized protein DUF4394
MLPPVNPAPRQYEREESMKARIRWGIAALATIAAMVVGLAGSGSAATLRLQAFGISSDGNLMAAFKTDTPQVFDWVRVPTGYVGDTSLIGMDFRVQDGKLYAVGNRGGIYIVSLNAGFEATLTKVSQLTATLSGTNFGVDFNPAADRLRVVSDTGQNLRHDLNTNTTVIDGPLSATGVSAAAYTNNDLNSGTATTLFDIVAPSAQVAIQSPPNNGNLAATGTLSCVTPGSNAGLDIYSDLGGNGRTNSNVAFAAFTSGSTAGLYTVDLLTANCTFVGAFPLVFSEVAVTPDTN